MSYFVVYLRVKIFIFFSQQTLEILATWITKNNNNGNEIDGNVDQ